MVKYAVHMPLSILLVKWHSGIKGIIGSNYGVEGGGQAVLSCEQCFILFQVFLFLFAFVAGGLGFEF